jgi:hypothetical protein
MPDPGPLVKQDAAGLMVPVPDTRGDRLPDFSGCGYMGGGVVLPRVPVKATLLPDQHGGDDTRRIQAALDRVAAMPADARGLRGAVLLKRGRYRVAGSLQVLAGGVVLRGEGQSPDGTVVIAAGKEKRHLVEVGPDASLREIPGTRVAITDERVRVGARIVHVADASAFKPGDAVALLRPATAEWIRVLGMDRLPAPARPWEPRGYNFHYERKVVAVEGNRVTLDVPVVCALERRFGGGSLYRCETPGRIRQAGVENLRFISAYDPAVTADRGGAKVPVDEEHAVYAVSVRAVEEGWVSRVTSVHFAMGTVTIGRPAKRVTVADCACLDPVSLIQGGRRYSFALAGQQCLVTRCYARQGRHDFVMGSRVPGPNAFVDCLAEEAHANSEPHHRWATGTLYDNVTVSGPNGFLSAGNRGTSGSGHGWSGAWTVFWNCSAPLILVMDPPTARNIVIGARPAEPNATLVKRNIAWFERQSGEKLTLTSPAATNSPDSVVSPDGPVRPRSLYLSQLKARLGPKAVRQVTTPTQWPRR